MLLMYVVIGALSTLAMAARARHASTYPFGVRYPYPTTKKERALGRAGGPARAAAAQPPLPVANPTRPDTNSRDMTDTAA